MIATASWDSWKSLLSDISGLTNLSFQSWGPLDTFWTGSSFFSFLSRVSNIAVVSWVSVSSWWSRFTLLSGLALRPFFPWRTRWSDYSITLGSSISWESPRSCLAWRSWTASLAVTPLFTRFPFQTIATPLAFFSRVPLGSIFTGTTG